MYAFITIDQHIRIYVFNLGDNNSNVSIAEERVDIPVTPLKSISELRNNEDLHQEELSGGPYTVTTKNANLEKISPETPANATLPPTQETTPVTSKSAPPCEAYVWCLDLLLQPEVRIVLLLFYPYHLYHY
jgi:hypothetical protein